MTTLTQAPPPRKSALLLVRYRELRDAGASAMVRREAYNDWFRQCCAEGRNPSALRIHSPEEAERFWAQTVPGPDGHIYWTGAKIFRTNSGFKTTPRRWAWARTHGSLSPYTEIENVCGEGNCVNVEHMRIRPRAERRVRFSDDRAIGALQVLALRLGRTPARTDWDAADLPVGATAMQGRFGSWSAFCRKAGLEPQRASYSLDPATCLEAIRTLTDYLGHPPTQREWKEHHGWLRERGYPTSPNSLKNKLGGSFTAIVRRVLGS